jgi:hypothetical protein
LSLDERGEIAIGEHPARALRTVAGDDVAERPRCDVTFESFYRTGELRCGFGRRAQAIGRGAARLALALASGQAGDNLSAQLGIEIESVDVHAPVGHNCLDNVKEIEITITETRHVFRLAPPARSTKACTNFEGL